jgi:hypothetical protein
MTAKSRFSRAMSAFIERAGSLAAAGRRLGRTAPALRKWMAKGKMPRTEYTGETRYVDKILRVVGDEFTRDDLLPKDRKG